MGRLLVDELRSRGPGGRGAGRQRLRDRDAAGDRRRRAGHRADRPRRHQPGRARRRRRAARAPRLRRHRSSRCRAAGRVLDPATVSGLGAKVGHDIVTSSGDTLLGADDKAGVAEIVTAVSLPRRPPRAPPPHAARLLHARRGDRRGRDAVRRRALRRVLRLHDGRQRDRRAAGRDVHGRRGHADHPRRRHPPRLRQGHPGQRGAAGGAGRRRAALRSPDAGDDRGPRGLHPPLRDRRRRAALDGHRDRPRLRR